MDVVQECVGAVGLECVALIIGLSRIRRVWRETRMVWPQASCCCRLTRCECRSCEALIFVPSLGTSTGLLHKDATEKQLVHTQQLSVTERKREVSADSGIMTFRQRPHVDEQRPKQKEGNHKQNMGKLQKQRVELNVVLVNFHEDQVLRDADDQDQEH